MYPWLEIRKAVPPDVTLEALAFRAHSSLDEMNPRLPYKNHNRSSRSMRLILSSEPNSRFILWASSYRGGSKHSILGSGDWVVCMGLKGPVSNLSCIVTRVSQSVHHLHPSPTSFIFIRNVHRSFTLPLQLNTYFFQKSLPTSFSRDVSAWTLFEISVLCFTPIASYSVVKCSCSPRTLWHFNHTRL